MKTKVFCTVVLLCTCLLMACNKGNNNYDPIEPPIEEPEEPEKPAAPPSTNNIINVKIGGLNMIVGSQEWCSIAYSNGRYVAVGYNDNGVYSSISEDGINWYPPQKVINDGGNVIYPRLRFLESLIGNDPSDKIPSVCSNSGVYQSSDGLQWSILFYYTGGISDIIYAYDHSRTPYLAASKDGKIFYSDDGENWDEGASEPVSGRQSLSYGNNMYVMAGPHGQIRYTNSPFNTKAWNVAKATGSEDWNDVTFANRMFVAVGNGGNIGRSANGKDWELSKKIISAAWLSVTFTNGRFVAVGVDGNITTSEDGINWTTPFHIKDEQGNEIRKQLNGVCAVQQR